MSLPPLVRQLMGHKLAAWCEARVPEHIRPQLRYEFGIRAHMATISEARPMWDASVGEIASPCAQIRYEDGRYRLYCRDRNRRWHVYTPVEPSDDLDVLLSALDEDPTGIFFG